MGTHQGHTGIPDTRLLCVEIQVSLSSPQILFRKISFSSFCSKAMVNISGENYLLAVLACAASVMLLALTQRMVSQLAG